MKLWVQICLAFGSVIAALVFSLLTEPDKNAELADNREQVKQLRETEYKGPRFKIICLDGYQYWVSEYYNKGFMAPRNDKFSKQLTCQGHETYVEWDGQTDHKDKE